MFVVVLRPGIYIYSERVRNNSWWHPLSGYCWN